MGQFSTQFLKGLLASDDNQKSTTWEFHHRLAAEIVVGAIRDWRMLIGRKAWLNKYTSRVNFNELRLFFKSEWCAFLLQDFEMQPEKILEIMEAELRDAMENHTTRKRIIKRRKR